MKTKKKFQRLLLKSFVFRIFILALMFHFNDYKREIVCNKNYIWNEMHSIAVVKCIHSSILGILLTGGVRKNILFCLYEKRENYIYIISHNAVAISLKKMYLKINSIDL